MVTEKKQKTNKNKLCHNDENNSTVVMNMDSKNK